MFDFKSSTIPPEDIIIFTCSETARDALENQMSSEVCYNSRLGDQVFTSYGMKVHSSKSHGISDFWEMKKKLINYPTEEHHFLSLKDYTIQQQMLKTTAGKKG